MVYYVKVFDKEDNSRIQACISSDLSGVILSFTDRYNKSICLVIDDRILKYFCNTVSKTIKRRAQKNNHTGEVVHELAF
jgi:hypothetical protein